MSHRTVRDRDFAASRVTPLRQKPDDSLAPPLSDIEVRPADSTRSPAVFDTFYCDEYAAMVSLARSICGSHAQAEEIAQDAFTQAHESWAEVAVFNEPSAWIRRVTINKAISRRRRISSERKYLRRLRPPATWAPADDQFSGDPALWRAIGNLSPRQRAAIALFYGEDKTTREIATIFDCTISTATTHLDQARKRLAKFLDAEQAVGEQ